MKLNSLKPTIIFLIILNCSVFAQLKNEILAKLGPYWFDQTYAALREYVSKNEMSFITFYNLPKYAQDELKSAFSYDILENIKIYSPVPLNSLRTRIGFINKITDLLGGVKPTAQTFENNIYLENFDVRQVTDRKVLAHEIVHVKQYLECGYEGFKLKYKNAVLSGKSYYKIPLEEEAYFVGSNFPFISTKIEIESCFKFFKQSKLISAVEIKVSTAWSSGDRPSCKFLYDNRKFSFTIASWLKKNREILEVFNDPKNIRNFGQQSVETIIVSGYKVYVLIHKTYRRAFIALEEDLIVDFSGYGSDDIREALEVLNLTDYRSIFAEMINNH